MHCYVRWCVLEYDALIGRKLSGIDVGGKRLDSAHGEWDDCVGVDGIDS
jgi:hypothetical protein